MENLIICFNISYIFHQLLFTVKVLSVPHIPSFNQFVANVTISLKRINCAEKAFTLDTWRKLKVHKMFRVRPWRLRNVLCTLKDVLSLSGCYKIVSYIVSGRFLICLHTLIDCEYCKKASFLIVFLECLKIVRKFSRRSFSIFLGVAKWCWKKFGSR